MQITAASTPVVLRIARQAGETAPADPVSPQRLSDQELFGDPASRYGGQFVTGRDLDVCRYI
jgi:hypothetical protein